MGYTTGQIIYILKQINDIKKMEGEVFTDWKIYKI